MFQNRPLGHGGFDKGEVEPAVDASPEVEEIPNPDDPNVSFGYVGHFNTPLAIFYDTYDIRQMGRVDIFILFLLNISCETCLII